MNFLTSLVICNNCPPPTALTTIPENECLENIGQIQRYLFVREGEVIWDIVAPANNVPVSIVGDDVVDVAGWNTLIAAIDATKVVKTPLVGGDTTITAGTELTSGGGDNSTLSGVTQSNGINPSLFTGRFDGLASATVAAMRLLNCEKTEVYFVNQEGSIYGKLLDDGVSFTGFPVLKFFLAPKANNGFGTRDSNVMTFEVQADYDEYLYKITPTFNILTF